jgi:aconitase A
VTIDLAEVAPCVSGPKSCKEKIPLTHVQTQFRSSVATRQGRKILGILGPEENPVAGTSFSIDVDSRIFTISHGTVLVSVLYNALTSSLKHRQNKGATTFSIKGLFVTLSINDI